MSEQERTEEPVTPEEDRREPSTDAPTEAQVREAEAGSAPEAAEQPVDSPADPLAETPPSPDVPAQDRPQADIQAPVALPEDAAVPNAFPEDVADQDAFPEDVADQDAFPEDVADQDAFPEDVAEPEPFPGDVADQGALPDDVAAPKLIPEDVADQRALPDDVAAQDPLPQEVATEGALSEEVPAPLPRSEGPSADASAAVDEETVEQPVTPSPPADQGEPAPAPAPAPAPTPKPRPVPRPLPRPPAGATAPAAASGPAGTTGSAPSTPAPPTVPAPPALSPAELAEAARWGRVEEDGTVWVRESAGERAVGQYPGADPDEALGFYVRRFADLHAKVVLFEARLSATDLSVKEIDSTLNHLAEELAQPAVVGDLDGLRARVDGLRTVAAERRAAAEAERAAAKKAALEARTAIVEAAEKIAGTEPERIQWRPAGEQLRELLDQWKGAQRHGPRVDRGAEDALWKRFSHARSTFDRERRRYFSELEKTNASAKAEKTRLVAEAERLATSTDWGATASAYRDLMTQWKAAGRASRKDDDALWARFRAAQDRFFAARAADQQETDAEFAANLQVKLGLLEEAERLLPVRDLAAARSALRSIQERWEDAGKVPRGDVQRVEGRLRAVEQAVRDAEQNQWRRSNPETRARAEGAAAQLVAAIEGLEADLASAKATGDARRVADAQAALDARRAWLEQVERAAAESRG